MSLIEKTSALNYATKQGRKQGHEEMINAMKAAGITNEQIQEALSKLSNQT
jgi:competence protein ComGF